MAKATETALGELHAAVAETLTHMVGIRTFKVDGVETTIDPSPAALAAAITFLKNNNITADPEKNDALDSLAKKLAESRKNAKDNLRNNQRAADDFAERVPLQ